MIRGKINSNSQPWVIVELLDTRGWFNATDIVLDTGFTGDLLLPLDLIERLEVIEGVEMEATLANGRDVKFRSWLGTALWHDRPTGVVILEANGAPLLGMNLLRGSRLTLDALNDGDVTIDELPL